MTDQAAASTQPVPWTDLTILGDSGQPTHPRISRDAAGRTWNVSAELVPNRYTWYQAANYRALLYDQNVTLVPIKWESGLDRDGSPMQALSADLTPPHAHWILALRSDNRKLLLQRVSFDELGLRGEHRKYADRGRHSGPRVEEDWLSTLLEAFTWGKELVFPGTEIHLPAIH